MDISCDARKSGCCYLVIVQPGTIIISVWAGFREMRALIAFILLTPLLGWIIKHEQYVATLLHCMQKLMKSSGSVYLLLMIIMMVNAFFFNLGVIFLVFA
jgi:hypothetical protein